MKLRIKTSFLLAFGAAVASGLTLGSAVAADDVIKFGQEKFQINLGYYRPNYTTSASVGVPNSPRPPASISGEDDLRLDSSLGVLRVDGYWRFADRHRLFFGYYNLDRDSSATLTRNIGPIRIPSLGVNDTILAGTAISATSKWDVYTLGYGYSFYKTDKVEVAGLLGVNVVRMNFSLTGNLNTQNSGMLINGTAGDNSTVTAPLPVIGLTGDWAFADRWRLKGHVGGFKANFNDVDATVTDLSVAVDYRLMKNFGVGAGWNMLKVTGDVTKSDWNGSLDWRTGGWMVYGSLVF